MLFGLVFLKELYLIIYLIFNLVIIISSSPGTEDKDMDLMVSLVDGLEKDGLPYVENGDDVGV